MEARGTVLHLLKLCVGVNSVEDLRQWQNRRAAQREGQGRDPRPRHWTRNMPRRRLELLDGGSIYWVIRHRILVRQRITDIVSDFDEQGRRRAVLIFEPTLIRTVPKPKRPFQGWRYFSEEESPDDLPEVGSGLSDLPQDMRDALASIGVR